MAAAAPPSTGARSAFFYGTLMAPQVLHRVCHGSSSRDNPIHAASNLRTAPAVLHGHRRHRVRHADYPAIVPTPRATVRGTYVAGLTDADVWRLDIFEGGEYAREAVRVRLLVEVGDAAGAGNVEGADEVEAEAYIWIGGRDALEEREWDFAEFQREKMRFWVGREGEGEYAGRPSILGASSSGPEDDNTYGQGLFLLTLGYETEVDEAVAAAQGAPQRDGTGGRGANGHITQALEEERVKETALKNAV